LSPHHLAAACSLGALAIVSVAHADSAQPSPWRARYEIARDKIARGECQSALPELDALTASATSETDKQLAIEMAHVCRTITTHDKPALHAHYRSTDEMAVLYANAFIYGMGTASWFVLEVQPSVSLEAMLPFAGFTIGSVGAVATIDHYARFPSGVPQAIGSGLYLGLGEGIFIVGYQHARSTRISNLTGHDPRWSTEESATVLWTMSTIGIATGALLGYGRRPTPGRVAFTSSMTLWGGLLGSAITSAVMPYGDRRTEDSFLVGLGGYNLGLIGGLILAPQVDPSAARMRFVDLGGVGGALLGAGVYALAAQSNTDARAAWGVGAIGAAVGLGVTWFATTRFDEKSHTPEPNTQHVTFEPMLTPLRGGGQAGVAGVF
jgi:hypothetical protein